MKITKAQLLEWEDLYELAVSRYLDKTDFSPFQWLDGSDLAKFQAIEDRLNQEEAANVV